MTKFKTVAKASDDLSKALIKAGLLDGSTIQEDEIEKREKTIFWPNRADNPIAVSKRTFAVASVHGLETTLEGDDGSTSKAVAYIDFYTLADPDDAKFVKEVANVETQLEKEGWFVEPLLPIEYDPQSKRHQLTLSAEKNYQ